VRALIGNRRKASCVQHSGRERVVLDPNCYLFYSDKRHFCSSHVFTQMYMKYYVE